MTGAPMLGIYTAAHAFLDLRARVADRVVQGLDVDDWDLHG
jgi:hypothetical protein